LGPGPGCCAVMNGEETITARAVPAGIVGPIRTAGGSRDGCSVCGWRAERRDEVVGLIAPDGGSPGLSQRSCSMKFATPVDGPSVTDIRLPLDYGFRWLMSVPT